MPATSQDKLFRDEEKLKEIVYKKFDTMSAEASKGVENQRETVEGGSYDDQEAFMVYGQLSEAQRKKHEVETLVSKLYERPYFAHVEMIYEDDEDDKEDYFLSDCESLDRTLNVGHGGYIIPFKKDSSRAISGALFHCYQAQDGKPISYSGPQGDEFIIVPKLICQTDVENRSLLNVNQLYPLADLGKLQITADEMLDNQLQENRDNPTLRNIISTLQSQQFEIISSEVDESFVVQGCAGSGKSQCLIHRLFFLRDELSQVGWREVLLLTPTKLFRQYSAELMRRYSLTDIYDCSIADLYKRILNEYDDRFKDRQYVYQMTEEYLPDGYLYEVYEEENVQKIESEIDNAIYKYVKDGCDALGIDIPDVITIDEINKIVEELDVQMQAFDAREEALQDNQEYQGKRKEYEQIIKDIETARRKQQRLNDALERNKNNQSDLKKYTDQIAELENGKKDWMEQREKRVQEAVKNLEAAVRKFERGTDLQAPAKYAKALYLVKDITEGERFLADEEEIETWDLLIEEAKKELGNLTRDRKPQNVIDKYAKRQEEIKTNIEKLSDEINELVEKSEEFATWLRNAASEFEGQEAKNTLLRSEMQQARYFLSRIESSVFEQEVWKALAPIKEEFDIQTLEIESLKDGKRKESRILYKSDLLFYVRIYMKLHPNAELPAYSLICIDEGQDLHRADYDILHGLYPDATFNIFGDVNQVLHASCGISDWKAQTGIGKVYPLTTNYRNTAAIVDFCNNKFDVAMKYIGRVDKTKKPIVVTDWSDAQDILTKEDVTLIVKDREAYIDLCEESGLETSDFAYLDTTSDKPEEGLKECYSIFAAKGLEYKNVFVYAKGMSKNQKVVASTRAMGGLYYYE